MIQCHVGTAASAVQSRSDERRRSPCLDQQKLANSARRTAEGGRPHTSNTRSSYFTSTVAPASVNFFLMVSASSLEMPSFTLLGAPSTSSLASFRPRLVTSRTALITLILLAPTSLRTTVNSVFSSAGAAAAAPAPPPATITGAAAAADTPKRASSFLTRSAASRSDSPTIESSICCRSAMLILQYLVSCFRHPQARFPVRLGPSSRQTTVGKDRATPEPQTTKLCFAWRGHFCPRNLTTPTAS